MSYHLKLSDLPLDDFLRDLDDEYSDYVALWVNQDRLTWAYDMITGRRPTHKIQNLYDLVTTIKFYRPHIIVDEIINLLKLFGIPESILYRIDNFCSIHNAQVQKEPFDAPPTQSIQKEPSVAPLTQSIQNEPSGAPLTQSIQNDTEESPASSTSSSSDMDGECRICLDAGIDTQRAFFPCGHQVCCDKCIISVKLCPMCRSPIKQLFKIYRC